MFNNTPNSSDIISYNSFLRKEKDSMLNLFENDGSIYVKLKIEVENIYNDYIAKSRGDNRLIDIYSDNGLLWSKNSLFEKLKKFKEENKIFLAVSVLGLFLKKVTVDNYVSYDIIPEVYELAQLEIRKYNQEIEKEKFKDTPYRVLTIDGGGILGYYQAGLLEALSTNDDTDENVDVGSLFDLICGTSTGSILAAGLAKDNLYMKGIKGLYKDNAKAIFPYPKPQKSKTSIGWKICHFSKPSACQTNLHNVLRDIFQDQTLIQLSEEKDIKLFIPSIYAKEHTAVIFDSENEYKNYKVSDVCLASSAAPIYFPLAKIQDDKKYIDGGLWANNPILIGLVEALKYADKNQTIEIYSLSAPPRLEDNKDFIKRQNQGIWHWEAGIKIIDVSLNAQSTGYFKLAENFIKYFNDNTDREIILHKFNHAHQDPEEIKSLRLDNSEDEHFEDMDTLVERAKNIQSRGIVKLFEKPRKNWNKKFKESDNTLLIDDTLDEDEWDEL